SGPRSRVASLASSGPASRAVRSPSTSRRPGPRSRDKTAKFDLRKSAPPQLLGAPILFSIRVEGRQAAGLRIDLLPHPPGQRFEGLELDAAALVTPGSGYGAIHQEGGFRVRGLGVENERAKALGKDLRPPSVHEQGRIPRR